MIQWPYKDAEPQTGFETISPAFYKFTNKRVYFCLPDYDDAALFRLICVHAEDKKAIGHWFVVDKFGYSEKIREIGKENLVENHLEVAVLSKIIHDKFGNSSGRLWELQRDYENDLENLLNKRA
jgi:hypothetical protein